MGTIPAVPSPASNQLVGGKARRRLMPPGWDGGPVVVRGRESRPHGEGVQRDRSNNARSWSSLVNIGDPWPDLDEAELRVHAMQTKLHQWAISDPDRRFDDLYNLVYDPAFLVVAWSRVRDNKGAARPVSMEWFLAPSSSAPRSCSVSCERTSRHAGSPDAGAGDDDPQGERETPPPWHPDRR